MNTATLSAYVGTTCKSLGDVKPVVPLRSLEDDENAIMIEKHLKACSATSAKDQLVSKQAKISKIKYKLYHCELLLEGKNNYYELCLQ